MLLAGFKCGEEEFNWYENNDEESGIYLSDAECKDYHLNIIREIGDDDNIKLIKYSVNIKCKNCKDYPPIIKEYKDKMNIITVKCCQGNELVFSYIVDGNEHEPEFSSENKITDRRIIKNNSEKESNYNILLDNEDEEDQEKIYVNNNNPNPNIPPYLPPPTDTPNNPNKTVPPFMPYPSPQGPLIQPQMPYFPPVQNVPRYYDPPTPEQSFNKNMKVPQFHYPNPYTPEQEEDDKKVMVIYEGEKKEEFQFSAGDSIQTILSGRRIMAGNYSFFANGKEVDQNMPLFEQFPNEKRIQIEKKSK